MNRKTAAKNLRFRNTKEDIMAEAKIPVDLILSKLAEDAEKTPERVQKAKDVLLSELDTAIATTPYEVVYQEDRVQLKHYYPVLPKNKLISMSIRHRL